MSIKNVNDDGRCCFSSLVLFFSRFARATAAHETLKQGKDISNIVTAGEEEVAR